MEQRDFSSVSSSTSPSDILRMAREHCKPRISLVRMAESKVGKAKKPEQAKRNSGPDIDQNTRKLVMLTISSPFLNTSGYYDLLDLNYRKGNAAKNEAIRKKLLTQHRFHSGRRGGQAVLLEPSATAFAMFKLPPVYENPGFLHRYLQHQVKETMTKQGFRATLEKSVKGKSIDVVLERDSEKVAVEIAVTDKHELVNIRKDIFQSGFKRVVIIGKDKKVVAAVEKKMNSAFDSDVLSKVRCCVLADFIDGKNE